MAIADYQSEADEDVSAREREESKRLLYVALTRARDRLYLSATVKDGQCRMGKGSLGGVLPAAVRARFIAAVGAGGPALVPGTGAGHGYLAPAAPAAVDDFEPLI